MATELGFDGGLTCALECADVAKSIAWYREALGFELMFQVEEIGWAELESPVKGVTVGLSQVENPQVRGGATLTFGVTDLKHARTILEARDVQFDGDIVVYPGMVELSTLFDPDGNKLMLYRDLTKES